MKVTLVVVLLVVAALGVVVAGKESSELRSK